MSIRVKICGLRTPETVDAAVRAGANLVGFMFFEKSPRHVSFDQARALAARVPAGIEKVGVMVDPDDEFLKALLAAVPLDVLQLHGGETPSRTASIREQFKIPVMKVLGIADVRDLAQAKSYVGAADRLMLDTKPPKGADRPGGNAQAFDWTILDGWKSPLPWLLAGGLRPDNVEEALTVSGAPGVDVSSGVETAPGVKDIAAIESFIAAVRGFSARETASSIPGLIL